MPPNLLVNRGAQVTLIGYLGRDPDVRYTKKGDKLVKMSLATHTSCKDGESGERKEETDWHRIVILNQALVTFAERVLQKGQLIYVEGQLKPQKWEDAEKNVHKTYEIILGNQRGELLLLEPKKKVEKKPQDEEALEE
ncbi:MAG: single-stranded DNA-binding protein [Rickettsiales bacterium]|nr:single-stranded DNA-binding protein [Rickettsiales bacterium]